MAKTTTSPLRVAGAMSKFLSNIAEVVKDPTVGAQQVQLLLSLYINGGSLNQIDLPKHTGVEKSANSRNIAVLGSGLMVTNRTTGQQRAQDGLGLVEAYEDFADRRFKMVRLTPKGQAVIDEAARLAASSLD